MSTIWVIICIFLYVIIGSILHFWAIYLQSKYRKFGFTWINNTEIGITYFVMSIAWPMCLFVIVSLLSTVYYNKLNS